MNIQHPASSIQHPVLVVGGGLAGTAMAWRLWRRGAPFVLVDPDKPHTCSKVAAGLVTPVTGIRLKPSWRMAELLPVAQAFYNDVEQTLADKFFHSVPQARLFKNKLELSRWQGRRLDPDVQQWFDPAAPSPLVDPTVFHDELGGFQQDSGWLDTAGYLAASRGFFQAQGCWRVGEVADADLEPIAEGVRWQDALHRAVVLCRGADECTASRFFPWLQWGCARGVIAQVQTDIAESRIINRGCWMLPRDGGWRAGSTYEFDLNTPMEKSVEDLRGKLGSLLRVPFEIVSAHAGIRPIVKRVQLMLGRHPTHERVLLFNGLGSKGVLRAPFFSRMLVEHLLDGAALDEEVDVRGNE